MTRKYQGRTALRGQITVKFEQKDYDRIERTARCRGISLAQQVREWTLSGMWSYLEIEKFIEKARKPTLDVVHRRNPW